MSKRKMSKMEKLKRYFESWMYQVKHPVQAIMWRVTSVMRNPETCKHCEPGDCGRCKRSMTTGINCSYY